MSNPRNSILDKFVVGDEVIIHANTITVGPTNLIQQTHNFFVAFQIASQFFSEFLYNY